ncbi:aminotransferase class I/II-fold pyridoxal phosphate-dependent enzyme [Glutamicibacter mysorens]|uniref:aminotransferase class I/II-fold pyridoxal phosphate-dependent enzyme n=1 Tax=Glutamicibacter mysorens TaxID=257984 RepID=UPI0020C5BE16|nr:aminotransferase class I/II-fold pyridoxal phosphate-dependent enzyme [Glutamicibacter mysorens]UTM47528.1 aminotransferase class I/II-fold pyridoxal phosphate-dependent enzyme [Glutamicibacter mysorens]
MSIEYSPWQRTAHGANLLDSGGRPGVTIFEEITGLANLHQAINLGQGFPDSEGPEEIKKIAIDAIQNGANQYAPGSGIPSLREAIVAHQERFYALKLDPESEVVVSTGATEAIAASLLAFLEPGDEVVTFEPYYDSYAAMIGLANAVHKVVQLKAPKFEPDMDDLRRAVTDKTRVIVVNNPHNPTGTVLDISVLQEIIALAHQHNCIIIADEVYEHLTFGIQHVPIASLPGGFERTITISSAGKSFSFTGWKVGWATGPRELITAVRTVKQFLTYSSGPAFQPAVALALNLPDAFFESFAADLGQQGEILASGLEQARIPVIRPKGTYFLVADVRSFDLNDAAEVARMMPERVGVAAIPMSAFVHPENQQDYQGLLRFAFCKKREVISDAVERLQLLPKVLSR